MKKGNFLEKIVSKSLFYLNDQKKGFFIKSPIPNKAILVNGSYKFFYSSKAFCDFFGIYNKCFILIECKEIRENLFYKKRLKMHQQQQLRSIENFGGKSIIIFYLHKLNQTLAIQYYKYNEICLFNSRKSIQINDILSSGFNLTNLENNILNIEELLSSLI